MRESVTDELIHSLVMTPLSMLNFLFRLFSILLKNSLTSKSKEPFSCRNVHRLLYLHNRKETSFSKEKRRKGSGLYACLTHSLQGHQHTIFMFWGFFFFLHTGLFHSPATKDKCVLLVTFIMKIKYHKLSFAE